MGRKMTHNRFTECGDYIAIEIVQKNGRVHYALVDTEDYHLVSDCKWHVAKDSTGRYRAMAWNYSGMSRVILGLSKGDPIWVDHINGDTLDNRRNNLRLATPAQNSQNRLTGKNNSSGVRGVYWHKCAKKWYAVARVKGKLNHLGAFDSVAEAKEVVEKFRAEHMPFSAEARIHENQV